MATDYLALLRRALAADPLLAAALHEMIEPLLRYDRENGGDLVRTLRFYFRSGGNLSQAAGALFLHRNSLYYRIDHIQALTGLRLDVEQERLLLQLAVLLAWSEHEAAEEQQHER